MAMNYTPLPDEFLEEMEELSDAEYGRLVRWAQKYHLTGEKDKLPGNERFYAKRIQMQIDRFNDAYQEKCEKSRESARKRWDANACERMPTDANACEAMRNDADYANTKPKPNTKPISPNGDNISNTDVLLVDVRAAIIDAWNALGLSQVARIMPNSQRYTMLNARIREYGQEEIIGAIQNIRASSFLRGQNSKGWVVTFDWFIRPNNFVKVRDGNYNDMSHPRGRESTLDRARRLEMEGAFDD